MRDLLWKEERFEKAKELDLAKAKEAKVDKMLLEEEIRMLEKDKVDVTKILKKHLINDALDEELEDLEEKHFNLTLETHNLRKELMRELNKNDLVIDPLNYKYYKEFPKNQG